VKKIALIVLVLFIVPAFGQPQNLNGLALINGVDLEAEFRWDLSSGAASYNFYQGPAICADLSPSVSTCPDFVKLNTSPIITNEFTHSYAFDGVNYLYAVTEVDSGGAESEFSNQLEVRVKQTRIVSSTTETTTIITTGPTDWLDELLAQGF